MGIHVHDSYYTELLRDSNTSQIELIFLDLHYDCFEVNQWCTQGRGGAEGPPECQGINYS